MARTVAKDHEEKRLAILGKAAEFFAANGYDRSSMNQLATACGVSKALIYHYYNSKEALLYDIVHTHLSALRDTLAAVPPAANPDMYLRALIHAMLNAYRDADAEHKVQTEAMTSLPDAQRAALADVQRQMIAIMSDALQAVTPEIYARQPVTLRPVAMTLFGMINWFYMWHRPGKDISRDDYADLVTDLVLGGVRGL